MGRKHDEAAQGWKGRRAPPCDVLVKAGGVGKPARPDVGTGASARPSIGITTRCHTHMPYIVVTLEVSHPEMSWSKLIAN